MKKMKLDLQFFASGIVDLGRVTNTKNAWMIGRIKWTATAGSPADNYSLVTLKLQAKRDDQLSEPTSGYYWKGQVTITDDKNSIQTPISFTSMGKQVYIYNGSSSDESKWTTFKEVANIKVYHNDDGTCTPVIAGYLTGPTGTSFDGKTVSSSQEVTFDRIPRSCKLSTIPKFDVDMGFVFNSDKPADSLYRKLVVKNGATVLKNIYEESLVNGYEYLLSPDINTIYSIMSNEWEHTFTFELYTYADSSMTTQIGSASVQTAVGYIKDCTPTFSGFDCYNSREVAVSMTGSNQIYIPNYSDATITISTPAVAYKGAKIVGYNINGYGYVPVGTYPLTYTIKNISSSFNIQAVDSRGAVSNAIQKNLTFLSGYKIPEIRNFLSARNGGIGTEVKLVFSGTIWDGNFGNGNNKITKVAYRVQPRNGSYSDWYDITNYLGLGDLTSFVINEDSGYYLHANGSSGGFSAGLSYTVQLVMYDGTNGIPFNQAMAEVIIQDGYVLDSYYKAEKGYRFAINGMVDPAGDVLQVYDDNGNLISFGGGANLNRCSVGTNTTSTGLYIKLCNIKTSSHVQGRFANLRIYIGNGNNGNNNQNAFINLTLQQGWTGSNNGVFGGNWELHPLLTPFNLSNVNVVVTADDVNNYSVWFYTTATYCVPSYSYECDSGTTIVHIGNVTQATVPTGALRTCDVAGVSVALAGYPVGSIYQSTKDTDPKNIFGGTWKALKDRFLLGAGGSYSVNAEGGSKDAIVVAHTHGMQTAGAHTHTIGADLDAQYITTGTKSYSVHGAATGSQKMVGATNSAGGHTHTIDQTGSSGTNANMPPYKAVYMWERTA